MRLAFRWFALATVAVAGTLAFAQSALELNNRGIEAYNAKNYAEAIQYLEEAYENSPANATVRRNLCRAHQEAANRDANAGRLKEAVEHLELAIGIDPENHSPLVQLGAYYLNMGLVPEAIYRLEEAIELKPGDLTAHETLGEAYYRDNDLPSARAQWEFVLEMDPSRKQLRERYNKAFREESVEQEFRKSNSRHFNLTYPPNTPIRVRSRVLTMLERAYIDIGRNFNRTEPPGPIQVVLYTAEDFTQATQLASHVGAVFDGKIRVPITDHQGKILDEDELQRRVKHEYVHVVVRYLVKDKVPWWLNEGLAETFSRDFDENSRYILARAFNQGIAFKLGALEGSQIQRLTPDELSLGYIQAHATANMLWTKYGRSRMNRLMDLLGSGDITAEEAIWQTYRKRYSDLEEEVARSVMQ